MHNENDDVMAQPVPCAEPEGEFEDVLAAPSLQELIYTARAGGLQSRHTPETIAAWFEGLDEKGQHMIELVIEYGFSAGYNVGAEQWGGG